jgi:phosphate:Na+ symporter
LDSFLIKLSGKELTSEDNNKISQLLLIIGEYERIGDHASNISKIADSLNETNKSLSNDATIELKTMFNAVSEIYDMSLLAYKTDNVELAMKVEPLEAVIKKGVRRAKNNHIQRLKEGLCNIEIGFYFSDLLNDLRRIAAHCANIATSVIQLYDTTFDKHEYSHRNKEEDTEFNNRYKDYKSRYRVKKLNENKS